MKIIKKVEFQDIDANTLTIEDNYSDNGEIKLITLSTDGQWFHFSSIEEIEMFCNELKEKASSHFRVK
jgi:hypothetical protein